MRREAQALEHITEDRDADRGFAAAYMTLATPNPIAFALIQPYLGGWPWRDQVWRHALEQVGEERDAYGWSGAVQHDLCHYRQQLRLELCLQLGLWGWLHSMTGDSHTHLVGKHPCQGCALGSGTGARDST